MKNEELSKSGHWCRFGRVSTPRSALWRLRNPVFLSRHD